MVHEAFGCMICSVIASPVSVPRLPAPLLGVIPIDPRVIYRFVEACCVLLKPFPLVVMVSLHETWLMVEVPRAVELAIPLPEPLPKVHILLSPRNPAQIVGNFVLFVLLRQNLTQTI